MPGVSYVAAGMAVATGFTAATAGGGAGVGAHAGTGSSGPSFIELFGWFHTMATNGMLSVEYPPIYHSFSKNFAFSAGLIPWDSMQSSIDSFRRKTGGNLTENSVDYLRKANLIFDNDSGSEKAKRAVSPVFSTASLMARGVSEDGEDDSGNVNHVVKGIQGYVEKLSIPEANTFMTILLVFAIVIAVITVGILLLKVILEVWALYGSFPEKLTNFRKDYWGLLARTITNLILVLYGIWTLYCVFQFTRGDSWAAKFLAAVTLIIFSAVLAFFTYKIWSIAQHHKKLDGNTDALYEDKENWRKYSLFYDHYKKSYWWIFVPVIVYMLLRGCIIAGGDGHGLAQSAMQFVIEALMLALLVWARPFETKSSQWINISIQAVRVLSIACIFVFVQELGVSKTTKTVTGIVLIAVQSTLTGLLVILMAVHAIMLCVKKNPHAERQKQLGK